MVGRTLDWQDELERWLKPFLDRLGHKARRRMCPLYVSGRGAYLTRFQRSSLAGRASITRILQPTSVSYVGFGQPGSFTSIPRCPRHVRCGLNRRHDVAGRRTVERLPTTDSAVASSSGPRQPGAPVRSEEAPSTAAAAPNGARDINNQRQLGALIAVGHLVTLDAWHPAFSSAAAGG
jgi:hypothetical protein